MRRYSADAGKEYSHDPTLPPDIAEGYLYWSD